MNEIQIECHANWYVVWYWEDEKHFVNKKFLDYEDAEDFVKLLNDGKLMEGS